jgi:hypothetical protein
MNFFSSCEATDDGVRISILFIPWTIPYAKIVSVRRVSFWDSLLKGLDIFRPPMINAAGSVFANLVLIETTKRQFITVTPESPDHFIRQITNRLKPSIQHKAP